MHYNTINDTWQECGVNACSTPSVPVQTAAPRSHDPAQASSSSKNAGPSLRASKMLRIFRSLGQTRNVFLSKMDALRRNRTARAACLICQCSLTKMDAPCRNRTARAARLNCHSALGSLRDQSKCLIQALPHRIGDPGIAEHFHDHEIQRVPSG